MSTYAYPDPTEGITAAMIGSSHAADAYWTDSESLALQIAERCVEAVIGAGRSRSALDIGTGEGRLLPWLAKLATTIAAVDPDSSRLSIAAEKWQDQLPPDTRVEFMASLDDQLAPGSASIVLCSHVLQHVPAATQEGLLERVSVLAAPGSVLLLLFTQGSSPETYVLEKEHEGHHVVEEVDQDAFESHAATPQAGVLPVRFVDAATVSAQLVSAGWSELARWEHHVKIDGRIPSLIDDLVRNADQRQQPESRARDLLLVFSRGMR